MIARAGKLLSDESCWTQEAMARTRTGRPTSPLQGSRYDIIGAIYCVAGVSPSDQRVNVHLNNHAIALAHVQASATHLHRMSAERVNDELGHAAVMDVLRHAWRRSKPTEDEACEK